MAEILCPMCGQPNPDELETCQQCQARLKPLIGNSPTESSLTSSDLPDWLDDDDNSSDAPLEDAAESGDWLARIRNDVDSDSLMDASSPEEDENDGNDDDGEIDNDWLERIRTLNIADHRTPETPEPDSLFPLDEEKPAEQSEGSLPDWLSDLGNSADPAPTPESESQLPDWLTSANQPPTPYHVDPVEETPASPDWLTDTSQESALTPAAESDDIPDWMSGLDDEILAPEAEAQPKEQAAASPSEQSTPDWFHESQDAEMLDAEEISDDEIPNWLSDIDAEELTQAAAPLSTEDGEPGWLKEMEGTSFSEQDSLPSSMPTSAFMADARNTDDELFGSEELPTWLGGDYDKDETNDKIEVGADDLAPSALPNWLEAMRPVDVVEKGSPGIQDHGPAETSGPLAGLSGVLKAEPEFARLQKMPAFSAKLEVSDEQHKHAAALRELIEQENTVQPVPLTFPVLPQRVLRWMIAALLIFVVGFAVIRAEQPSAPVFQGMVPAEVFTASEQISTLSPEDTVLIAFDYEPGISGEINTAAVPVLDHIMLKGASMALISTAPTGPALAEQMLSTLLAEHRYMSGHQYINLGYIPGGASGLLGFSQIPQQITPLSFDGMNAWQTRPLEGIRILADFSLVLVITDSPDIARTWFEQIRPSLAGTPIIAIVSAQAEPILQPYYSGGENAQIQGLVSGILGGAAYEQTIGRANLASQYWNAFNLGMMISILVIFLGSAVNGATTMIKRNQDKQAMRKTS